MLAFPLAGLAILFYFQGTGRRRAIAESAIYAAQTSPQLAALVGRPIEPGWPVRGHVNARHGNGNADLQIPLRGSLIRGMLLEQAQQTKGHWQICSLLYRSDAGAELELVNAAETHCQPE